MPIGENKIKEGTLPARPGEAQIGIYTDDDNIIIELFGNRFELAPIQALSFCGTVMATLEVYYRSKSNGGK